MITKFKILCREIFIQNKWLTISNFLTFIRILITPFIVVGIFYQKWTIVFCMLFFAGITDILDGYLARLFNEDTLLGKILDPLADKILTISSFTALAFLQSPSFYIPAWFVYLIVFREIIVLSGTYFLLRSGIKFDIAPTVWGKLTAFLQLLFIFWLFVCHFVGWAPARTYHVLLILLAVFSVLSFIQYFKIGIRYLRS